MKSLFIEARYRNPVFIGSNVLKLPEKIGLVTTVQFIEDLKNIKKEIEKKGKKIFTGRGRHTVYDGQVLGCDVNSAVSVCRNVDAFLYIGSGEFHPLAVALNTGKDVFTFNPMTKVFGKIDLKKQKN